MVRYPFSGYFSFTHIRLPHHSEILTLFLSNHPLLHIDSIISPSPIMKYISHTFFSHISPLAIPSSPIQEYVSNSFTLQPLPVKYQWDCAYQVDRDTKGLLERQSINTLLNEHTILKLPAAYRTAIVCNILGLLEGRLVY